MQNALKFSENNALLNAVEKIIHLRPLPLREYDQIHMRTNDIVAHLNLIAPFTMGKRVFFMGDSDGVALSLAFASSRGLLPSPTHITLCDFDERIVNFVRDTSRDLEFTHLIESVLYNVFDPFPAHLTASADVFHTNPPYGQYNNGKSVIAFAERGIAAIEDGGLGIIVLGNDPDYPWTHDVLRSVLQFLVSRQITPNRILDCIHSYHLDDQPKLKSGIIFCQDVAASKAFLPSASLPEVYKKGFYGRKLAQIPRYIRQFGLNPQLEYQWNSQD